MKMIDLHSHTTASDGIKTPRELIDYAIDNGVDVLAITDHDTVGGIEQAIEYSSMLNFTLISGIEFSIDYKYGSFHLVGLNINHLYSPLVKKCLHLQDERDKRIYKIVEDLKAHGIHVPVEDVLAEGAAGTMGRPHVARTLIKHGYSKNISEVFKHYLVKGKPGYVKKERIELEEAVLLIKGAGGIPIIAHPASIHFSDFDDFDDKLKGFIDFGVEGIEVYASMHSPAEVRQFKRLAQKYDLIISGGSDYHGDKNEEIGHYLPGVPIPREILKRILP